MPEPGELTAIDEALLAAVAGGFESVGAHLEGGAVPRGARRDDAARLARQPVRQRPGAVGARQDATATARRPSSTSSLRAVDSLKTLFTPFLPHTSQRVHELLGYEGFIAGPARVP